MPVSQSAAPSHHPANRSLRALVPSRACRYCGRCPAVPAAAEQFARPAAGQRRCGSCLAPDTRSLAIWQLSRRLPAACTRTAQTRRFFAQSREMGHAQSSWHNRCLRAVRAASLSPPSLSLRGLMRRTCLRACLLALAIYSALGCGSSDEGAKMRSEHIADARAARASCVQGAIQE